jgi:hypothetical protein
MRTLSDKLIRTFVLSRSLSAPDKIWVEFNHGQGEAALVRACFGEKALGGIYGRETNERGMIRSFETRRPLVFPLGPSISHAQHCGDLKTVSLSKHKEDGI